VASCAKAKGKRKKAKMEARQAGIEHWSTVFNRSQANPIKPKVHLIRRFDHPSRRMPVESAMLNERTRSARVAQSGEVVCAIQVATI
jgi:hypothetical protein